MRSLRLYLIGKGDEPSLYQRSTRYLIGCFKGGGIGPELIDASLKILAAAGQATKTHFDLEQGGPIGEEAAATCGQYLPEEAANFCASIFHRGGAILSGPGGGRYVYDLRRRFDLFCKFVPIRPWPELTRAGRMVPQHLHGLDILIVRDNTGGAYQGSCHEEQVDGERMVEHRFSYGEPQVRRLIEVAVRAASARSGRLHVIIKDGGLPTLTALWRDVGMDVAAKNGVEVAFMNIDLAAYELIQNPSRFDVIVTPNLFGDILADLSGVLLSSRGNTFSGNFNSKGHGVYQTNHGCAHDLIHAGTANPVGQFLSLAMLLRESLDLDDVATLIEKSLAEVWRQGWRTPDLAEQRCQIIGTRDMTSRIADQIAREAESIPSHDVSIASH